MRRPVGGIGRESEWSDDVKIKHILLTAAAATAAASAGSASAQPAQTTLNVTANVTANCSVTASAVDFSNINPLLAQNFDATGSLTISCTSGAAWSAALGVGSGTSATYANRRMRLGATANMLNYSLYTTAARNVVWGDGSSGTATVAGTGTGSAQTISVFGRIPSGQTTAPAGAYADSVTVTVTY